MIEIKINETDESGNLLRTRYTRAVDHLDIEATIAAISAVIAKQAPQRKRRSDVGRARVPGAAPKPPAGIAATGGAK